jgi:hypothetical protein
MRQPAVYSYGIKHRKWERDHRPTEKQATYLILCNIVNGLMKFSPPVYFLFYSIFYFFLYSLPVREYSNTSPYNTIQVPQSSLFQTASTTTILKHYCALARKCIPVLIFPTPRSTACSILITISIFLRVRVCSKAW